MPRPRKQGGDSRTITVRVRFTPLEKSQLAETAKSRGLSMSDLLRTTALNAAPLYRKASPERAAFIKGLAELGKIGSNVNQIARTLNVHAKTGGPLPVSLETINDTLVRVDSLADQLIKAFTDGD